MRCVPTQIIFSKVSIFILCLKTGSMQDIHRLFYYFNYFILFIFLYLLIAYLTVVDTLTEIYQEQPGVQHLNTYIYGVAVELIHKPSDS